MQILLETDPRRGIPQTVINSAINKMFAELYSSVPGAMFNGSTDDSAALVAVIAAAGTKESNINIIGPMFIGSNVTVPRNVQLSFIGGGLIKPGPNVIFTINGPITAGPWQIFDISNSGANITGTAIIHECFTEWFGAVADGVTDCTIPFNATATFARDANYIDIQLLKGTYKITGTVYANGGQTQSFYAPSWYGIEKYQGTILSHAGIGAGVPCFKFVGGSGRRSGPTIRNIQFTGDSTTIGAMVQGTGGLRFENCLFANQAEGIQLHNEQSGSFTEHVVASNCDFSVSCITAMRFRVTAGNNSFRASGIGNDSRMDIATSGGQVMLVDSGAFPYKSPLDILISGSSGTPFSVVSSASTLNPSFLGKIQIELFTGATAALADTQAVYFSGPVHLLGVTTGSGANVVRGTMIRCEDLSHNIDGSVTVLRGEMTSYFDIVTGANTLGTPFKVYHRQVYLQFIAANYDYRYLLSVENDGSGSAGYIQQLDNPKSFNTAGYGAPAFTVDTSGNLVATQAGWPASGVQCYLWERTQTSGGHGSTKLRF